MGEWNFWDRSLGKWREVLISSLEDSWFFFSSSWLQTCPVGVAEGSPKTFTRFYYGPGKLTCQIAHHTLVTSLLLSNLTISAQISRCSSVVHERCLTSAFPRLQTCSCCPVAPSLGASGFGWPWGRGDPGGSVRAWAWEKQDVAYLSGHSAVIVDADDRS